MATLVFIFVLAVLGQSRGTQICLDRVLEQAVLDFPVCATRVASRFLVAQRSGKIVSLASDGRDAREFLDLSERVALSNDPFDQRGLLSLALHPEFERNGHFFVHYVTGATNGEGASGTSVVSRFTAQPASAAQPVDRGSEIVLLRQSQPAPSNNGGALLFHPSHPNLLFVGFGDGGSAAGSMAAQNLTSLLGKLLRIDVTELRPDRSPPYSIPSDNPFVNTEGARGEVWALGVRNPWRCSPASSGGGLVCVDPGQDAWEEINAVEAGGNYGWPVMEGPECAAVSDALPCDPSQFQAPRVAYANTQEFQSVIDGRELHIDRGAGCALSGKYVFYDAALGFSATDLARDDQTSVSPLPTRAITANGLRCETDPGLAVDFYLDADDGLYVVAAKVDALDSVGRVYLMRTLDDGACAGELGQQQSQDEGPRASGAGFLRADVAQQIAAYFTTMCALYLICHCPTEPIL